MTRKIKEHIMDGVLAKTTTQMGKMYTVKSQSTAPTEPLNMTHLATGIPIMTND